MRLYYILQGSISSTFYERVFCTKVLCTAFLYLRFGFVIFWLKNIGKKVADKMLMKLAPGDFTSNVFTFSCKI